MTLNLTTDQSKRLQLDKLGIVRVIHLILQILKAQLRYVNVREVRGL